MKVAFSPVVNFKANLLEEMVSNPNSSSNAVSAPKAAEEQESAAPPLSNPMTEQVSEDKFESRNLISEEKVADFQAALKNKKWEKKYFPESDLVWVRMKKAPEGEVEYVISPDGTVKETSANMEPDVIMEANSKMSEVFSSIKSKQSSEPKAKKPGNWLTRGISDIWTALSVAGTMTVATAKGVFYGALTGAGVIAASTILNMSKLMGENKKFFEILKSPIKSAGKGGKIAAAVASLAVLASYVISGKLSANENAAVIDHKMHTGHRDA
ncbi:hypothetical protein IJ596_02305 [bacterium]|nr:hypothetical protein [bacterium]